MRLEPRLKRRQQLDNRSVSTWLGSQDVSRETKQLDANIVLVFPIWELALAAAPIRPPHGCPHIRTEPSGVPAAPGSACNLVTSMAGRYGSSCAGRRTTRPSPLVCLGHHFAVMCRSPMPESGPVLILRTVHTRSGLRDSEGASRETERTTRSPDYSSAQKTELPGLLLLVTGTSGQDLWLSCEVGKRQRCFT